VTGPLFLAVYVGGFAVGLAWLIFGPWPSRRMAARAVIAWIGLVLILAHFVR
jgi:hypothetical protein